MQTATDSFMSHVEDACCISGFCTKCDFGRDGYSSVMQWKWLRRALLKKEEKLLVL